MLTRLSRLFVVLAMFLGLLAVPAAPPVEAAGSFPFTGLVDLDVGPLNSCGVFLSGAVACWGQGGWGHFADSNLRSRTVPTVVAGVTDAEEVAVGNTNACARLTNGTVQCWGGNSRGQVGKSVIDVVYSPHTISGLTDVVALAAGGQFVCALIAGGSVKCWGDNTHGQLGSAVSQAPTTTPTTVAGLTNVVSLDAGVFHICARRSDNTARCWGSNQYSQLGFGAAGAGTHVPTSPTGLTGVLDISTGLGHTCAIVQVASDEVVRCWGSDGARQLGGATAGTAATPQPAAASITNAVEVSADGVNTCVRRAGGTVSCWGYNMAGTLGNGTTGVPSPTPSTVTGISDAAEIGVGFAACARLDSGSVKCWGMNSSGALGVGASDMKLTAHSTPELLDLPIPEFSPIVPTRLLDTRPTGETVDDESEKGGLVGAGQVVKLRVRNRAGIAATAPAVVLNITAVQASANGYVTVWPCDVAKPVASNLNVVAGVNRANLVVTKVAAGGPDIGKVCLSPSVAMHLLADGSGYYSAAGDYSPLAPARLLDTRPSGQTIDGASQGGGMIGANVALLLSVGGRGGVAANARAVVLNLTAVGAAVNGHVTVWPCGQPKPTASNLNVTAGVTVANLVMTGMGDNKVCISPSTAMHLIVDVAGYMPLASPYESTTPFRVLDTRPTGQTIDGNEEGAGLVSAGGGISVSPVDRTEEFLTAARTVVLTVTAVQPAGSGYLSVKPCAAMVPFGGVASSNLNVTAGVNSAATVMVELGDGDEVCISSSVATHVLVDVQGWYAF